MNASRLHLARLGAVLLAIGLAAPAAAQLRVPDDFATIQAAVDASASGGWILVRAGTYAEQVLITGKTLTLRGESGATLTASPGMVQNLAPFTDRRPVVAVKNGNLHLRGLAFDGLQSANANESLAGAYFLASSGTVLQCSFTGFRRAEPVTTAVQPVAVHASNPEEAAGPPMPSVLIAGNSVCDSEIGFIVKGDVELLPEFDPNAVRLHATIQKNTVVGIGWVQREIGILSQWGVRSVIVGNDVSGFSGVTPAALSVGIVLGSFLPVPFRHPHSLVMKNRLTNNSIGVFAFFTDRAHIGLNQVVAGPSSAFGIAISGENGILGLNLVDMRDALFPQNAGIVLLGLESGGPGFVLGKAVDTLVIANLIAGAGLPIWEQTGSSGTRLIANRIQ